MKIALRWFAILALAGLFVAAGRRSWLASAAAETPAERSAEPPVLHVLPELPTGSIEVVLLRPATPARFLDLALKLRASLEDKQDWLEGYLRSNNRAEQPLPWHPRFGLTRSEYADYLELAGDFRMRPLGRTKIEIVRRGDELSFRPPPSLAALTPVTLDLVRQRVRTPYGDCAGFVPVRSDAVTQTEGPWKGWTCETRQGDPESEETSLAFSLGRFENAGALYLAYEGQRVEKGELLDRAEIYLSIPPPPTATDSPSQPRRR